MYIMSILYESELGWFISHSGYIDEIYVNVENVKFVIKSDLFKILTPYKSHKKNHLKNDTEDNFENEVLQIKDQYKKFKQQISDELFLKKCHVKNIDALRAADQAYRESGLKIVNGATGSNHGATTLQHINNTAFLFPENCKFYCKDVADLYLHLNDQKFDVILLDPPWWNKYIRRKRKHSENAYDMMYNNQLKDLPLERLLNESGIIVVWCTNSAQHFEQLQNEILPKWGVNYQGKWYWLKVTQSGEPICEFSKPPSKQPFEQIILGYNGNRLSPNPPTNRLVVSVPSAIHSHKPPLTNILKPYLPENPACLEIFARYLLPNWTSYGNEVLRFQNVCLFDN